MVTGMRGLFENLLRFMSFSVCKNTSVKMYKVKQAHISLMNKTKKVKKRGREGKKGRIVGGMERGREERKRMKQEGKEISIDSLLLFLIKQLELTTPH